MQKTLLSTLFLLFTIQVSAVLSVSTSVVAHSNCGRANGRATAFAFGGLPPYTYSWNGGIDQFGTQIGLAPGTYTVTVIDAALEQASADVVIDQLDGYGTSFEPFGFGVVGASYCDGELAQLVRYTGNSLTEPYESSSPYGPGPYSYEFGNGVTSYSQVRGCADPNGDIVYDVVFMDATPGTMVTVNYADLDGCPGTAMVTVPPPFEAPTLQILNVTPSCQNDAAGTMNVAVTMNGTNLFGLYVRPVGQPVDCVANEPGLIVFEFLSQNGLKTFDDLPPGDLELVWTTDPSGYSENPGSPVTVCEGVIPFTVPLVPTDCGSLRGTVYIDDDANCTLNSENRIAKYHHAGRPWTYLFGHRWGWAIQRHFALWELYHYRTTSGVRAELSSRCNAEHSRHTAGQYRLCRRCAAGCDGELDERSSKTGLRNAVWYRHSQPDTIQYRHCDTHLGSGPCTWLPVIHTGTNERYWESDHMDNT